MTYISIKGEKHRVIREWTENGKHYIEYYDNRFEKTFWNVIGIETKTSVMENGRVRWNCSRLNKWNPLTYGSLVVIIIASFVMTGVKGVVESVKKYYGPTLDNSSLYSEEDIIVDRSVYTEDEDILWLVAVLILSLVFNVIALFRLSGNDSPDDNITNGVIIEMGCDESITTYNVK